MEDAAKMQCRGPCHARGSGMEDAARMRCGGHLCARCRGSHVEDLFLFLFHSPGNLLVETSTFTLPLTTLTLKTQCLPPSWPPYLPRTMLRSVLSARLYQVGYEIFVTAATDAAGRRPSGHLSMALTLKMRCPSLDWLPLGVAGVCPATVVVGPPTTPIHRI